MARAKQLENLDCGAAGRTVALQVLRARLTEMIDLRRAALEWENIEGVHDMRVASRRLRSAVADFEFLFTTNDFAKLERRIKKLARALGTVRDQDVAIASLEKLVVKVDEKPLANADKIKQGINEFILRRAQIRDAAREQLSVAIAEGKLAQLHSSFDVFARKLKTDAKSSKSSKSFIEVGRAVLHKRWRDLTKHLSASIYTPLDAEGLHRARIEAKKMRYALELFDACWQGNLDALAKQVAELQGALGDVHDLDEWAREFSGELPKGVAANQSASVAAAAFWLLQHCATERAKHYRDALKLWQSWLESDFQARLQSIIDETRVT